MIRGLGGPGSTAMHIPASIELRPIIFGNSPVSFLREFGPRFISRYCNSVNLNIRYTFGYKTFFNHFLLIYAQQIKVKLAAINIKFHYIYQSIPPFIFPLTIPLKKTFILFKMFV